MSADEVGKERPADTAAAAGSETTSSEAYPEVSGDESGIVPPQSSRPEWPKKIRTLTAAELDRLTIDRNGRFYWDGQLVNYEPHERPASQLDPRDQSAMDMLDRAVSEINARQTPQPIEGADLPGIPPVQGDVNRAVDLNVVRADSTALAVPYSSGARLFPGSAAVQFTMSGWQKLGAFIAVLSLMIGAAGMAAYGYVALSDWGCRTGLIQSRCPAPSQAPHRPDIPA